MSLSIDAVMLLESKTKAPTAKLEEPPPPAPPPIEKSKPRTSDPEFLARVDRAIALAKEKRRGWEAEREHRIQAAQGPKALLVPPLDQNSRRARTACGYCGQAGHWRNQCPSNPGVALRAAKRAAAATEAEYRARKRAAQWEALPACTALARIRSRGEFLAIEGKSHAAADCR